jgi:hypothetical protein
MTELANLYKADLNGAAWRKSSYTASNGNCVEVADVPGGAGIAVRDSKNVDIPAARVTRGAWVQFLDAVADDSIAG